MPIAVYATQMTQLASYVQAVQTAQAAQAEQSSYSATTTSSNPSPATTGSGSNGDYAADATSVDTPDWACIRQSESGGNYSDYSGAYGFLGADYGAWSPAAQDAYALQLFHQNGDRFSGTWNDYCTVSGGGWLS
jgi:hypothetical protein